MFKNKMEPIRYFVVRDRIRNDYYPIRSTRKDIDAFNRVSSELGAFSRDGFAYYSVIVDSFSDLDDAVDEIKNRKEIAKEGKNEK